MWSSEYQRIPRSFNALVDDNEAVAAIENDAFLAFLLRSYAYLIWPFMMPGVGAEIYSGIEPAWIFAHNPNYWIRTLTLQGVIPSIDFVAERLGNRQFPFLPWDMINKHLPLAVEVTMRNNNMREIIKVAEEYRCFEDFDYVNSRQKTDFYRKWYHTRTKHPIISLEEYTENCALHHNGVEWDTADGLQDFEKFIDAQILVDQFKATLSEKDMQILTLRMDGYTLEEIAKKLGLKRDQVERVLNCDLLILDDLGSEMTTAFVHSALYQIVNTRLMERRSTIISTNLTPGELARRYTPQIASRIEGEYTLLPFAGEDIRRLKKERAQGN